MIESANGLVYCPLSRLGRLGDQWQANKPDYWNKMLVNIIFYINGEKMEKAEKLQFSSEKEFLIFERIFELWLIFQISLIENRENTMYARKKWIIL